MDFDYLLRTVLNDGALAVFFVAILIAGNRLFRLYIEERKAKTKKELHDTLLESRRDINMTINDMLEHILLRTSASRAYIVEYHNGGDNLGGLPFLKMSNTYEVCNDDVESYQHIFQNLPCSKYPSLMSGIDKNDIFTLDTDNQDLSIKKLVYRVMIMQGMGKSIMARVTTPKGRVIGYVGLDYNTDNLDNFNNVDQEGLKKLAIEIGTLLTVR